MSNTENPMVLGPEPPEPRRCFDCDDCGEEILEGEEYYDFFNETFICENCISNYKCEAVYEEE